MPITASRFLAQYKDLKARIEGGSPSADLQAACDRLVAAFKASYSADTFKEALANNATVPSELEERLTSARIILNRERTLDDSRNTPPADDESG